MATLIGLCLRVKLLRSLPRRFKVDIEVTPGAHASEEAINKQLRDKERVAAALENSHLLQVRVACTADYFYPSLRVLILISLLFGVSLCAYGPGGEQVHRALRSRRARRALRARLSSFDALAHRIRGLFPSIEASAAQPARAALR